MAPSAVGMAVAAVAVVGVAVAVAAVGVGATGGRWHWRWRWRWVMVVAVVVAAAVWRGSPPPGVVVSTVAVAPVPVWRGGVRLPPVDRDMKLMVSREPVAAVIMLHWCMVSRTCTVTHLPVRCGC